MSQGLAYLKIYFRPRPNSNGPQYCPEHHSLLQINQWKIRTILSLEDPWYKPCSRRMPPFPLGAKRS